MIDGGGEEVDCGGADEGLGDPPEPDVVAPPPVVPLVLALELDPDPEPDGDVVVAPDCAVV